MSQQSMFQLEAPNADHLMTLQQAADSCGVTRQAFHGWNIQPARIEGTRKLYSLAAILENRLQAARASRSPTETDRDRLEARIELLIAQVERERVLAQRAAEDYAQREEAEEVISYVLRHARSVIEELGPALLLQHPKIEGCAELVEREIKRALEPLREGPRFGLDVSAAEVD